jgi:hypothetical protein
VDRAGCLRGDTRRLVMDKSLLPKSLGNVDWTRSYASLDTHVSSSVNTTRALTRKNLEIFRV